MKRLLTILMVAVTLSAHAQITGITSLCVSSSTTFADSMAGSWSSSNPAVITIDPTSGIATARTLGTVNIINTNPFCSTHTLSVTVVNSPAPIRGLSTPEIIYVGHTVTVSSSAGGIWSASDISVANYSSTSGGTAILQGLSTGTMTVIYTLADGCAATHDVNVLP